MDMFLVSVGNCRDEAEKNVSSWIYKRSEVGDGEMNVSSWILTDYTENIAHASRATF